MTPHHRPTSLCAPSGGPTCFHCCPPIRPEGHDTAAMRPTLEARLRENTRMFKKRTLKPARISGRHCWGLGFLDETERSVGCLLHPARNDGRDMRILTGFGEKCRREHCREAGVFGGLHQAEQERCLGLAMRNDSFEYSSRLNPFMRLLAWEEVVVRAILDREKGEYLHAERVLDLYAPLFGPLHPGVDGYWVALLLRNRRWDILRPEGLQHYLHFRKRLSLEVRQRWGERGPESNQDPMVHLGGVPLAFSRWLKFDVGIWRANLNEIKDIIEHVESRLSMYFHLVTLHS